MAEGPVIRLAEAGDVELVATLDREVRPGHDRAASLGAAQSEGRLLVAERLGEIVGYAVHGRLFDYDFLEMLVVRPGQRRRGVATALIRAVESRSRSGKLFTSTNRSNRPMQELCSRLGFEPSGIIENLDEGDPELFYVKRLSRPPSL